jgi:hypothetical protein
MSDHWAVYALRFRKSHKILAIAKKMVFGGMFLHQLCKASKNNNFFLSQTQSCKLEIWTEIGTLTLGEENNGGERFLWMMELGFFGLKRPDKKLLLRRSPTQ